MAGIPKEKCLIHLIPVPYTHTPKKALTQLYNEGHRSKLENQFRGFGKYKKKIQCITANYVCPSKLLDRELSNAFCKCKSL